MTQVGLTMFNYERDLDRYVATGYTFHLCPQDFADVDQSFIFQASTLKFLCKHNFNFNKVGFSLFKSQRISNQKQNKKSFSFNSNT